MQNVRQLLIDAINNGQSMLAHSLFVAMKKQIINGNDIAINLPFDRFPIDECLDAHKKTYLAFIQLNFMQLL